MPMVNGMSFPYDKKGMAAAKKAKKTAAKKVMAKSMPKKMGKKK
jgi:hypothetical protein